MRREEAVACLKEILALSQNMSPDSVTFEKYFSEGLMGYRVRIKGTTFENDRQAVSMVAKKHDLLVEEEGNEIIIYKPNSVSALL